MSSGNNARAMNFTGSFEQAIGHTKRVLFQPFEIVKWLCFGVIIFLEGMSGGCGGRFNPGLNNFTGGGSGRSGLEDVLHWITSNWELALGIGAVLVILGVSLGILWMWLGARGTMMFIGAVARGDAAIADHWRATKKTGNSLFLFRVCFVIVNLVVFGALIGIGIAMVGVSVNFHDFRFLIPLLPLILIAIPLLVAGALVAVVARNFVAPIMYRFDLSFLQAWQVLRPILWSNILVFLLFVLYRIGFGIALAAAGLAVGFLTCCVGFLPVLSQTILCPLYVFDRTLSLYMLESLGPDFRMIQRKGE